VSKRFPHVILSFRLKSHRILNTRKRVVVALVHTVVFLAVAVLGFFFPVAPLRMGSPPSAWIVAAVYVIVSSVLLWLTAISRGAVERLYFALVTTSASFGLLRQLLGDSSMHAAVHVRVTMLSCAVVTGAWMLRSPAQSLDRIEASGAAGGQVASGRGEGS
jgi:hypothetical protein